MANKNIYFVCKNCGYATMRTPTPDGYIYPCIKCNSKDLRQLDISLSEYLSMVKKGNGERYVATLPVTKSSTENEKPIPKCPICGSTKLSKITTVHKVGKIMALGVFGMGDNGKTWKCNDCGSRF